MPSKEVMMEIGFPSAVMASAMVYTLNHWDDYCKEVNFTTDPAIVKAFLHMMVESATDIAKMFRPNQEANETEETPWSEMKVKV